MPWTQGECTAKARKLYPLGGIAMVRGEPRQIEGFYLMN